MSLDRTSTIAFGIAVLLHGLLALALSRWAVNQIEAAEVPLLIEVTLSGSSAPKSVSEGIKGSGAVGTASSPNAEDAGMTGAQIEAWRAQRKKEIIGELARTRSKMGIGANVNELRKSEEKLAAGQGAGDWGTPGSPIGSLSLTGAIAARGYQEPDFSELKSMISEETQLRVTIIVLPGGEVKTALLYETSGYPFLDQKALELCRKIIFDPLPIEWKQVDQQGILTIKLKL